MSKNKKEKKEKYSNNIPVIADDLIGLQSSSDFSKIITELFGDENIVMKTDLTARAISKLTQLWQMADYYGNKMLAEMCMRFIGLRISKDRKGRTEAVDMTQGIMALKRLEGIEKMIEGGVRK
jgi:hypothetical protein